MAVLAERLVCHWCGPGKQATKYVPVYDRTGQEDDRLGVCDDEHLESVRACGYRVRQLPGVSTLPDRD